MGLTQLALHNPHKAVMYFRTAYKLDKQPGSALNLSSAYLEADQPGKALALLAGILKNKQAAAKYPYKERIFHNIGYSYIKLGQNKKAEQWLTESVEENPTFFPSHLELARLYEKTARPALAQKSYRRAMDYCHVCLEPVEALANIYLKLGSPIEARKVLQSFTKVEGITTADRAKAQQLLKTATTAGLNRRRAG
jgi:Tfp pilus assembly protein PilF